MNSILQSWAELFGLFVVAALLCLPAELLTRRRHSWAGRVRGAVFFAIFLAGYVVAMAAAQAALRWVGVKPLITLDLTGVGVAWHWLAQTAAVVVLAFLPAFVFDFAYYWFHRLQHAVPTLWRYHAVHHAIEELNATNCHHHWTEGFLRAALFLAPLMLLVELRVSQILIVGLLTGAWGQFVHANVRLGFGWLRWLFVSPHFHRVHHSRDRAHFDRNFAGAFPIIDIVFGTAHFPRAGEAVETGLSDQRETRTLGSYLRARPD